MDHGQLNDLPAALEAFAKSLKTNDECELKSLRVYSVCKLVDYRIDNCMMLAIIMYMCVW